MSAVENKRLIQSIFAALAEGNSQSFWDALSDDAVWYAIGTSAWSGRFEGKAALRKEIFAPLRKLLVNAPRTRVERLLADGDHVVLQGRGDNVTKAGPRYDNEYCLVFEVVDGRIRSVTEYLDTELVTRVLGAREAAGEAQCQSLAPEQRPSRSELSLSR